MRGRVLPAARLPVARLTVTRLAALAAMAALAGCHLPQPFRGNPGREAAILAAPPPARLAVLTPHDALLGDAAAAAWTRDTADALLDQSIPAQADLLHPGDWRLRLRARLAGDSVIPGFVVLTPDGQVKGQRDGTPVAAAAWSAGDPATLRAVAAEAVPRIVTTLTGLRNAELMADPNSLYNRPARIYFAGVTGAPGDGDAALAATMRELLPDQRDVLVGRTAQADYRVTCTVSVAPPEPSPGGRVQKTEIVWRVAPAQGVEAGAVTQLHDVPAGSLDQAWGDVAMAVVAEAAPGIRTVIDNHSGRLMPPPPGGGVATDKPSGVAADLPVGPDETAPGVPRLNTALPEPVAPIRAAQPAHAPPATTD